MIIVRLDKVMEERELGVNELARMIEQYVCQQIVAESWCKPRYWSADGKQAKGEVDFVCEFDGVVCPIEVKAGENIAGSSLSAFAKRHRIEKAVRLSLRGWTDQGWLVNVPLYAVGALPALLDM